MNIHPSAALEPASALVTPVDWQDRPQLSFFDRHGEAAVSLARLAPGSVVLDLGCGAGAATLPAAHAVGRKGHVLGVDNAIGPLRRAAEKAKLDGLGNVDFLHADMTSIAGPAGHYDAVLNIFSLPFSNDMKRQLHRCWRMLRPGGRLVVTVWAYGAFWPLFRIFDAALRNVRPDLWPVSRHETALGNPDDLAELFQEAQVDPPVIHHRLDTQHLAATEDIWPVVMGCGLRRVVDRLNAQERTILRSEVVLRAADHECYAINTHVLHAVAVRQTW